MCVFCSTLLSFHSQTHSRYQPYGPWPHVPESVWAQEEATIAEEENDDGVCCQLCGHQDGISEFVDSVNFWSFTIAWTAGGGGVYLTTWAIFVEL